MEGWQWMLRAVQHEWLPHSVDSQKLIHIDILDDLGILHHSFCFRNCQMIFCPWDSPMLMLRFRGILPCLVEIPFSSAFAPQWIWYCASRMCSSCNLESIDKHYRWNANWFLQETSPLSAQKLRHIISMLRIIVWSCRCQFRKKQHPLWAQRSPDPAANWVCFSWAFANQALSSLNSLDKPFFDVLLGENVDLSGCFCCAWYEIVQLKLWLCGLGRHEVPGRTWSVFSCQKLLRFRSGSIFHLA